MLFKLILMYETTVIIEWFNFDFGSVQGFNFGAEMKPEPNLTSRRDL